LASGGSLQSPSTFGAVALREVVFATTGPICSDGRARAANRAITQANIQQTICSPTWSTKAIRPPVTYTDHLNQQQLAASHATDQNPAHYEEDHFISLELGVHPHDPRNLWPERWGTPAHPLTSKGPFPSHLVGAKSKDAVENALYREVCAGTLTLREVQWIIATDWFKYYREKVLH
jgi:hypothetical protein